MRRDPVSSPDRGVSALTFHPSPRAPFTPSGARESGAKLIDVIAGALPADGIHPFGNATPKRHRLGDIDEDALAIGPGLMAWMAIKELESN